MKVRKTLKDNKKSLIIIGILWIILAIILVSPIAYSIVESTNNGIFDFSIFIRHNNIKYKSKAEKYRNIALQLIQKGNNKKDVREVLKSEGASPAEYGRAIDWAANKLGIKWDNITIQPEA